MATVTANGQYKYNQIFINKTLDEWIQLTHKNNAQINNWKFWPLKKGAFGYDNLAISIGDLFTKHPDIEKFSQSDIHQLADVIHTGWVTNYLYWRDHKPWVNNTNYTKPAQSLGDSRRNTCAQTDYSQLPLEEQKKDIDIVTSILNVVNCKTKNSASQCLL